MKPDTTILFLTSSAEPAWQDYVSMHPDATIYHTLEWRDILYNEYGFEPVYLIAKREGSIVGVLPMFLVKNLRGERLVSLPFSIYGGPIGNTEEVVTALLEKSVEMVKDGMAISLEIKPYANLDIQVSGVEAVNYETSVTIDLTIGVDALWKGLTDKNDVNRAVREGLKFKLSEGDGIESFYRLQLMTRKRQGLPTPSLGYYRSFSERMTGKLKLGLIEKEGTPVAGGMFFTNGKVSLYALGASDHRFFHLRPNDLLIWEMIKWLSLAGYREFDLGPTPHDGMGLLHFKRKWGGEEKFQRRYYFPWGPNIYRENGLPGRMLCGLFRHLPICVAKCVGSTVIKHIG